MTPTTMAELLAKTGSSIYSGSNFTFTQTQDYVEVGYFDVVSLKLDFTNKKVDGALSELGINAGLIAASTTLEDYDYSEQSGNAVFVITGLDNPNVTATVRLFNDGGVIASHATVEVTYNDGTYVGNGTSSEMAGTYTSSTPKNYIICSSTEPDVLDFYANETLVWRVTGG